ncbi:DUF2254 family protein [Winogradskyella maritima]|uniref:DUF2254 domain-containing protein n=1 Tax=Winogradskyella maritima TaxID=1517766 RepID=A0ABV8ADH6_9FLAO|nr:DUF2254 family protein [Winogradskyella maritima]
MRKLKKQFKTLYLKILNSLVFYPVLIIFFFFLSSVLLLSYETSLSTQFFKDYLSFLYLEDVDTSRDILSTLIASILSLMVFSFSMVMIVLSQASTNYSPRLLPQLISDTKRQIILGIYGGTLIHCILVLIALGSGDSNTSERGISVMVASILGLLCIILFVIYIQNISSVIRIDIIVKDVFFKTESLLDHQLSLKPYESTTDYDGWSTVYSSKTGYFKCFDTELIDPKNFPHFDADIHVLPYEYKHVWEGEVILKVDGSLNEDMRENLIRAIIITEDRYKGQSITNGLIKLMEVVVKAISSAKNDPGTATDVMHKIGRLLRLSLRLPEMTYVDTNDYNGNLIQRNVGAKELMRLIVQPIRNYSKSDSHVTEELLNTLNFLIADSKINTHYLDAVKDEIELIKEDVEKYEKNENDRKRVLRLLDNNN